MYGTYYGGAYLGLGFVVFAPLHALGVPTFPVAPTILRIISTLAGLLSVILLYNFAKRYAGTAVGLMAVFVLMTDTYFLYYTNIIHPDTLQLGFGLLTLLIATRHAEDGKRASLIALGLLSGLVQGTKAGGPWLIPMALLAVYWGLQQGVDSVPSRARFCTMLCRAAVLYGSRSLAGVFRIDSLCLSR